MVALTKQRGPGRVQSVFLVLFGAAFSILGALALYFTLVRPLFRVAAAQSWQAHQCVVRSSFVASTGSTYKIVVSYDYAIGGKQYSSKRYDFFEASTSGREGKQKIVDQYPSGRGFTCYVDPANPESAVINRGLVSAMWFGLIPTLFLAVGVLIVWAGLAQSKPLTSTGLSRGGSQKLGTMPASLVQVREVTIQSSPYLKLLGAFLLAGFWNGIVGVFVYHGYKDWMHGHPSYFLAIFLIPFVLIGCGFFVLVPYSILALFNPRLILRIKPGTISVGDSAQVSWEIKGNVSRIKSLSIELVGEEIARYRQGTSTSISTKEFARHPIFSTISGAQIARGIITLKIPEGIMPSFKSAHNRIEWSLRVTGEIPRWPDLSERGVLTITPRRAL